ncbi:tRNA methyltransferase complex GCD14 subunit-domain-containing protein, partial [Tribonema minus]
MIGQPYGSKVFSRSTKGFIYVLSPTPELWSTVVPNRTQIVQPSDQSFVIFRLDMKPGDTVIESGTGSGAMSTAIMRAIAPTGHLHTFEFNEARADRARAEFVKNGLASLVTVKHRDVCGREGEGGFGDQLNGKADAIFLDLPEPWLAVPHAHAALKPNKKVCSYSPCVEQVQRTCTVLREWGFHSLATVELRIRPYQLYEADLDLPDWGSSTATAAAAAADAAPAPAPVLEAMAVESEASTDAAACEAPSETASPPVRLGVKRPRPEGGEDDGTGAETLGAEGCGRPASRGSPDASDARASPDPRASPNPSSRAGGGGDGVGEDGKKVVPMRHVLTAKPAPNMRGHTAFLTFAIRGTSDAAGRKRTEGKAAEGSGGDVGVADASAAAAAA